MRKKPHDKILREKPKERYQSIVPSHALSIITIALDEFCTNLPMLMWMVLWLVGHYFAQMDTNDFIAQLEHPQRES